MLHLLNGDAVLPSMRDSGVPGEARVWGDVLWEGPLLRDATAEQQREARARYFSDPGDSIDPLLAMSRAWDEALTAAADHDEVVIWLEHDLHDQLQLLHHLAWFAQTPHPRLSLICIGAFPGVVPFHGLGQLDGAQLASLFPDRNPVTPAQLELGRLAWDALLAPSPRYLSEIWLGDTAALPYLEGALQRFFEEYPEAGTGLSRTERMVLQALATGPATPWDIFPIYQRWEERVFMGDLSFLRIVEGLAAGPDRLLTLSEAPGDQKFRHPARITDVGWEVLLGQKDRVALLGIDRWLGGVHLQGHTIAWRWSPATGRMQYGGR